MNRILKSSVLALALSFAASALAADETYNFSTATSNADAQVIAPIALSNTHGLNFGQIAKTSGAGSVALSTSGVRTSVGAILGNGASAAAAAFSVTGEASATYTITLPSDPIDISDGASPTPHTMSVGSFVDSKSGASALNGSGTDSFTVGATLTVGSNQATGSYGGSFDVTVTYN